MENENKMPEQAIAKKSNQIEDQLINLGKSQELTLDLIERLDVKLSSVSRQSTPSVEEDRNVEEVVRLADEIRTKYFRQDRINNLLSDLIDRIEL